MGWLKKRRRRRHQKVLFGGRSREELAALKGRDSWIATECACGCGASDAPPKEESDVGFFPGVQEALEFVESETEKYAILECEHDWDVEAYEAMKKKLFQWIDFGWGSTLETAKLINSMEDGPQCKKCPGRRDVLTG